jgi:sugar phosphate isomerase/epimerase
MRKLLIPLLSACIQLAHAQPTVPSRVGVVSYTYRNSFQKDVAATLDTIRQLGVTNLEFSNLFGRTAAEIRQLLDSRGMQCTSLGVGYDELMNNTDRVIGNAKALGARFVRVAWIPHDTKIGFTLADADRATRDFNRVGQLLKNADLVFCYHNHGYEFRPHSKGTLFDYIVANTAPEFVSFELDSLWAFHPGADPAELIRQYPDRFRLMHVKDLKKGVTGDFSGGTDPNNDVVLGTGQINIAEVLEAARKSSIEYYYIEDESQAASRQVPGSLAFLKKLGWPGK